MRTLVRHVAGFLGIFIKQTLRGVFCVWALAFLLFWLGLDLLAGEGKETA